MVVKTDKTCDAVKLDGSYCRQLAGNMTKHPGIGRCQQHEGKVDGLAVEIFNVASLNERMVQLREDPNVYSVDKELALLRAHLELISQYINEIKQEQEEGVPSSQSMVNYSKLTAAMNTTASNIAKLVQTKHDIEVGRKYVVHVNVLQQIIGVIANAIDAHVEDFDTRMRLHEEFNKIQLPIPGD